MKRHRMIPSASRGIRKAVEDDLSVAVFLANEPARISTAAAEYPEPSVCSAGSSGVRRNKSRNGWMKANSSAEKDAMSGGVRSVSRNREGVIRGGGTLSPDGETVGAADRTANPSDQNKGDQPRRKNDMAETTDGRRASEKREVASNRGKAAAFPKEEQRWKRGRSVSESLSSAASSAEMRKADNTCKKATSGSNRS